ncbi:hypothetical protein BaRGS_00018403 [Batillaria attramentaria]|uniref:Uncharacterized protein n=1 Tax=Batillaria attramentaria TaxID=370345 RepID=A0ABD0KTB0_9CAEN
MGDPHARKSAAINRLRCQLRKKRESLADQFDFKMYIVFRFKEKKKNSAVFEVAEVVPVMTNNYEDSIMKGAKEEAYSYESSRELLERDVVQLHAPRWQPVRPDILGCTTDMDYFLWPRNDIDRIECHVFSRWKGDSGPYRPIVCDFVFSQLDYERQLMRLLGGREKSGLIINNPEQTVFLFVDKHLKQTSKSKVILFKLSSVCLYIPQDQLMSWGVGSVDELLSSCLSAVQSH